jgi:hypothetical protein
MSSCKTSAQRLTCTALALCSALFAPLAHAATGADAAKPTTTRPGPAQAVRPLRLIVGFMGGRVHADNLVHKEAVIAQNLRQPAADNVQVLVFANHNGGSALRAVLHLIDQDGDGKISDAERHAVDLAIYGHSWGASETVALARQLQAENIPVTLTVQVDSVQKPGENDGTIPSNVREAVNLYQRDGLLRGRAAIRAEDPARTRILVNEQYHYDAQHTVDIARFPWFARTFMRQHIMIENDPAVWTRVEAYLRDAMQTSAPALERDHLAIAEHPSLNR